MYIFAFRIQFINSNNIFMTKQEFLAFSLPYRLHAEILDYKCDYVGNQYDLIIGILQWSKDGNLWCLQTKGGARPSFDRVKPILHPLTDFRKLNLDIMDEIEIINIIDKLNIIENANFRLLLRLVEEHFDIAGLIEKGEAIDVNTLSENPYK